MTDSRTQSYKKYERVKLSEMQEKEMVIRYGMTQDPITVIAARYGVHNTYPYRILDKHNVNWRRDSGITFEQWARDNNRMDLVPGLIAAAPANAIARDMQAIASNPPPMPQPAPPPRAREMARDMVDRARAAQAAINELGAGPPQPEPGVDAAADVGQAWHVEFLPQSVLVRASSIENALAKARARYPGLTIGSIQMASPEV